ncbi:MAG: TetR/AcrR family transcriptional regulator, partial [Myxococcales bacterium]
MSSGKRKGDSYHHGDLRRALLDGALALLQDEGVGALSLREVARRAGVTHAAPYRHFESKEELIAAVAEEGFHTLRDEMRDAMAAHEGDPRRRLEACGVAYVLFAVGHPAHFGVMWSSARGELQAYPGLARASE